MAVSVRIEDEAFSDARVELLGALAGYNRFEALGRLAHLWRICTQRQMHVVSEAIANACIGPAGAQHLVDAELAERTDGGIRVRGTEGRIEWLEDLRAKRRAAGLARAEKARRDVAGRLLPSNTSTDPAHAGHAGPSTSITEPAQSSAPAPAPAPAPAIDLGIAAAPLQLQPDVPEPKKAPRASRKKASGPMPEGWQPRDHERSKATELGLSCDREAERFRDHHAAKGSTFADWDAAFRTWLGNALRFQGSSGNTALSAAVGIRPTNLL